MTTKLLILSALLFSAVGWAEYPACANLSGPDLDNCNNVEFSKERMIQNSAADQYAQQAKGYRAPDVENDGRSGATLVSCDKTHNDCLAACKGNGGCMGGCHQTYVSCAGSSSPVAVTAPAEAPDGYKVEFNDEISKNQ